MSRTSIFVFCGLSLIIGTLTVAQRTVLAETRDTVPDLYRGPEYGQSPSKETLIILAEETVRDTDLFGVMRGKNESAASGQHVPPDQTDDLYGTLKDGRNTIDEGLMSGASHDLYNRNAGSPETSIILVEEKTRDTDLFGVIGGNKIESTIAGQPLPPDTANDLYGTLSEGKNGSHAQDHR